MRMDNADRPGLILRCCVFFAFSINVYGLFIPFEDFKSNELVRSIAGMPYSAVLSDDQGRWPGMLSTEVTGNRVQVTLEVSSHALVSDGYEAVLCLKVLRPTDAAMFDAPSITGIQDFAAQLRRKYYGPASHTYFTFGDGDGAKVNGKRTSNVSLSASMSGRPEHVRLRIDRRDDALLASWWRDDIGWTALVDQYDLWAGMIGSTPKICKDRLPFSPKTMYIGVDVDPAYNNNLRVNVSGLCVLIDRDDDGLWDEDEAVLGTGITAADTDGDGAADGDDPKPLEPIVSRQLPLPLSCTPSSGVTLSLSSSGSNSVLLKVSSALSSDPVTCTMHWLSSTQVTLRPARAMGGADVTPVVAGSPISIAQNDEVYLWMEGGDLAPVVDEEFARALFPVQTIRAAGSSRVERLDLAGLAYDPEDSTGLLSWSLSSTHNPGTLVVSFEKTGTGSSLRTVAVFTAPANDCVEEAVTLQVTDTAGNSVDLSFTLHFLGALGEELLANPSLDPRDPLTSGTYAPPAWRTYTWAGQYITTPLTGVTTGVLVEGISRGRSAVYQTVALAGGTYHARVVVGRFELTDGEWGKNGDILILGGGLQLIRPILPGPEHDLIWYTADLTFSAPFTEVTDVNFYVRFHGTGYMMIREASLVKLPCHPSPDNDDAVSIVTATQGSDGQSQTINFTVPFRDGIDSVLCGYCNDDDFKWDHQICPRCVSAGDTPASIAAALSAPAAPPRLIASFEKENPGPFRPANWAIVEWSGTAGGLAADLNGGYASADLGSGLLGDWSPYHLLKVDVFNNASSAKKFYVEIRDSQSVGYWSRVNWYTAAGPGLTTVTVPLSIFVGEKSVTVERRRLDLRRITRLVFAASLCSPECTLHIDNVRLEAEPPYANAFPQLLRFDLGTAVSPVELGFTPILDSSWYRQRLGYGLAPGTNIRRVEDRQHPTDLFRDWISIGSGGVNIDLPNGNYIVWCMLEDAGYWEFYQMYRQRKVYAEDELVLNTTLDYESWSAQYFRHQDDEDLPGDNTFERYVKTRYRPTTFNVTVEDGQLNLEFISRDTYGNTLSALILYPATEAERGAAFIRELWSTSKRWYDYEYTQIVYPGTGDITISRGMDSIAQSIKVFSRHPLLKVRAGDGPESSEERAIGTKGLSLSMSLGEVKPLTLSLRLDRPPGGQTAEITAVTCDVQGIDAVGYVVNYKIQRLSPGVYSADPLFLRPLATQLPLRLDNGVTRRIWFDLSAKDPGCYNNGSVAVLFSDGSQLTMPLAALVHAVTLPRLDDSGIWHGYHGVSPKLPSKTYYHELGVLEEAGLNSSLELLKSQGISGLVGGLGGPKLTGWSTTGDIDIDFSMPDMAMKTFRDKFPELTQPVNSYFGLGLSGIQTSSSTWNAAPSGPVLGKPYDETLSAAAKKVSAHAAANEWLDVHYNIADEPSAETLVRVLQVAKVFKAAAPEVKLSVHTSLDDVTSLKGQRVLAVVPYVDLLILNHHTVEAIEAIKNASESVEWMIYNQGSVRGGGQTRYTTGLYLEPLLRYGCRGHYLFALSSPGADPYYALDAREDDLSAASIRGDGSVVATVGMAEYRAARDDLRYALAYRAATANPAVPLTKVMQDRASTLDRELASYPIGTNRDGPRFYLNHVDLDDIRRRMVEIIEAANVVATDAACEGSGVIVASAADQGGPGDGGTGDTAASGIPVAAVGGAAGGALVLAVIVSVLRSRRARDRMIL